jgi:hypothetical protein
LKVLFSTLILAHFPSRTPKNHQATMKTRYCGHLYSSLLRKWTWWDHRDQVSYYMEGGLKGTEGSPPGRVGGLVGHPVSALLLWASPWVCSVAMAINRPFGVEMTNVHTACLFGSSGWSLRHPSLMGLSDGESLSRLVGCIPPDGIFEVEQRLEGQRSTRLSSMPLTDGRLVGLMSSQRVLLCGKADSKRTGLVGCEACWLCSPMKPRAILM